MCALHLVERGDVQDVLHIGLAMEGHQRADLQLIVCSPSSQQADTRGWDCAARVHGVLQDRKDPIRTEHFHKVEHAVQYTLRMPLAVWSFTWIYKN